MRFSVWPGPHTTFEEVLELARHAEATGWDGVWFADHFMPNAADTSTPTLEAWTTLAGLAAAVPRLRLGTLVTGNTYRHPAVLAKMAATLHAMSGGRSVLGLGSGWQENEHAAYGIHFGSVVERLRRLEEACQIIRSLFTNERTDFAGRFYTLKDAPLEPKPPGRLPLLIGGGGEKITLRIAARYADEWNVWGTPDVLAAKGAILDRHCEDVGRDPAQIERCAVALLFLVDDPAAAEKIRAGGRGRPLIVGSPAEVAETLRAYQDAGVRELVVPDFNLGRGGRRRAAYDRFIEEVAPSFR